MAVGAAAALADDASPRAGTDPYLNFETLKRYYEYPPGLPLDAKISKPQKVPGGTSYELTFRGADGLPVHGDVVVPDGNGPFPLLIAPAFMTESVWTSGSLRASKDLAQYGILTAYVDYRLQGRAARKGLEDSYTQTPGLLLWARMNTVVDMRRLLDFLFEKYNIDKDRVCYASASKGGWMGTILGAVDPRVKQFIIRAAGADLVLYMQNTQHRHAQAVRQQPWFTPEFYRSFMGPFDCQYFVHKLAPRPVLFLFGKRDTDLTPATFHKMLSLAGEPKEVIWYDAGHGLADSRKQASEDVRRWLAKQWKMPQLEPAKGE